MLVDMGLSISFKIMEFKFLCSKETLLPRKIPKLS